MMSKARLILIAAYQNIPTPEDWDLSDLKLYHAMRLMYAEYGMMIVDRDQAVRERDQLLAKWKEEKSEKRA